MVEVVGSEALRLLMFKALGLVAAPSAEERWRDEDGDAVAAVVGYEGVVVVVWLGLLL